MPESSSHHRPVELREPARPEPDRRGVSGVGGQAAAGWRKRAAQCSPVVVVGLVGDGQGGIRCHNGFAVERHTNRETGERYY